MTDATKYLSPYDKLRETIEMEMRNASPENNGITFDDMESLILSALNEFERATTGKCHLDE